MNGCTYRVRRYRPRIEGLFARIERWTNTRRCDRRILALDLQGQHHHLVRQDAREPHRRSRRSQPHLQLADLREPRRQGQCRRLRLQAGGSARIFEDTSATLLPKLTNATGRRARVRPTATSSASATATVRPTSRCSKTTPLGRSLRMPPRQTEATPGCSRSSSTTASTTPTRRRRTTTGTWPARTDPFSSYRAGFEVRTYAPASAC